MTKKISHDSETPAIGQQVITACAFIHADFAGVPKLFLPKRAKTKKFLPDVFELPGGHIDFGENIITGLQREILEEFVMRVSIGDSFAAFTYHNSIKGAHAIEVIYFARFVDSINDIQLHPQDHSEYRWFAKNEISEIIDDYKTVDDPEIQAIMKGFSLLENKVLNFG